jgi:hypothetical protein
MSGCGRDESHDPVLGLSVPLRILCRLTSGNSQTVLSGGLRLLPRLADDGRQVPGKILPPVEAPLLNHRSRCPGLVEIRL